MIRKAFIVGGFLASIMLLCMAFVIVCAINLVLNGYNPKCGPLPERIWRNAIPFMCSPKQNPPESRVQTVARPSPAKYSRTNKPKPRRSGCAPLQQEPRRVQCDRGVCYHDPGYRANCGLADNWNGTD
jgi:hypothetical protein